MPNSKKANDSLYDLSHHGDEVIVHAENDQINLAIKIQTGIADYRSIRLTFDTQTQCERLLGPILKGLTK